MRIIDPVCKMECDEGSAHFKSEYEGDTYCFCSLACKKMFDRNPKMYLDFGKGV